MEYRIGKNVWFIGLFLDGVLKEYWNKGRRPCVFVKSFCGYDMVFFRCTFIIERLWDEQIAI